MIPQLPATYKPQIPTESDVKLVSICYGWMLGFAYLTFVKACRQTSTIWRRTRDWKSLYLWLIWAEFLADVSLGTMIYLTIIGFSPYGFGFLLGVLLQWIIQTHALPQIIINRIAIIAINKRRVFHIKIIVFVLIVLINIGVGIIWIPAMMQISPRWVTINNGFDRFEKVYLTVIDVCLNMYFLYLVKTGLVANGLKKYGKLFWFNFAIVWVALVLDFLVIGMMSMKDNIIYLQFQPLAYMVKLNIEMTMADTIATISSKSSRQNRPGIPLHPSDQSDTGYGKKSWSTTAGSKSTCACGTGNKAWVKADESFSPAADSFFKESDEDLDYPAAIRKTTTAEVDVTPSAAAKV